MIPTPQIVQTEPHTVALIHLVIPRAEIQTVMGPAHQEIMAALTHQGITPSGPWLAHHHRKPDATFDFDVCVPVSTPVAAIGRVQPGTLPSQTAACTVYSGPYEGLSQTWQEFDRWISQSGHRPAPDFLERYTVNPVDTTDASSWQTELTWPLFESTPTA